MLWRWFPLQTMSLGQKMSNEDTSHVEHGVVGTVPCLGGFYNVPYVNYCIKSSVSSSFLSFQAVHRSVTLEESSESLLCCRYPKHKGCMQSQKSSLMNNFLTREVALAIQIWDPEIKSAASSIQMKSWAWTCSPETPGPEEGHRNIMWLADWQPNCRFSESPCLKWKI